MFDPVKLAKQTEKIVCRNLERKYYRFRPAKFYGGIATADCIGCCLRCKFCWAWNIIARPETVGRFYSPKQVAEKLISIARKFNFSQVRISGNEPSIGKEHLLAVLENLKSSGLSFILETNGILIDKDYALQLAKYKDFIHVRVSLKGANEKEFTKLTGAKPEVFELQLNALRNLLSEEVPCHPAVMVSFSNPDNIRTLRNRLETIYQSFYDFEEEKLLLYKGVEERLKRANI